MQVDRGRKVMLVVSGCLVAFVLLGGVLGRSLAVEGTYTFLKLFNEVLYLVRNNYVEAVDEETLMEGAYRGMLENLDPMGEYLNVEEFRRASRGERNGPADVGATLSKRHEWIVIVNVTEGSPAQKAGLGTGDLVLTIDRKSTRKMGVWQASQALQGKAGTTVRLEVIKTTDARSEPIELVRRPPLRPPLQTSVLEPGVGLLRLGGLEPGEGDRVRKALDSLRAQGVRRLLLDLRANTGPSLDEAVRTASLFLGEGKVVTVADRKAGKSELKSGPSGPVWKGPMVVLVGEGTAGPGEVLAAALRDRAGASLVGEKTWGLGSVQKIIPLPGGDGIRISVGKFLSPGGKEWNGTGLSPDVEQAAGSAESKQDLQLQKALEVLKAGGEERQAA
jgi:carboxyl-terminal processing protease